MIPWPHGNQVYLLPMLFRRHQQQLEGPQELHQLREEQHLGGDLDGEGGGRERYSRGGDLGDVHREIRQPWSATDANNWDILGEHVKPL